MTTREESTTEEARIVFVVLSFVENRTILKREKDSSRFIICFGMDPQTPSSDKESLRLKEQNLSRTLRALLLSERKKREKTQPTRTIKNAPRSRFSLVTLSRLPPLLGSPFDVLRDKVFCVFSLCKKWCFCGSCVFG